MICLSCGCSDHDPCLDLVGQPCFWIAATVPICSSCCSPQMLEMVALTAAAQYAHELAGRIRQYTPAEHAAAAAGYAKARLM